MIKQFTVGFGRTINLGNYESARVEGSVTFEIADGDDVREREQMAQQELRRLLEQTWKAQLKIRKEELGVPETAK